MCVCALKIDEWSGKHGGQFGFQLQLQLQSPPLWPVRGVDCPLTFTNQRQLFMELSGAAQLRRSKTASVFN